MAPTRRFIGVLLVVLGVVLMRAQEAPPNLRAFTITAKDYRFEPARIEVMQNDLVKVTVTSGDVPYGFAIDKFRVSKRIPAGGTVSFEFRADEAGEVDFYSNLTSDPRHGTMRGKLVVRAK